MAALATDSDLEARIGRALTTSESARSAALLADASAQIRGYTRQTFTPVEDDVIVLRPVGATLRLPQRPVTAVSAVVAIGGGVGTDTTLSAGDWTWDRIDKVELPGCGWRPTSWLSAEPPDTYRVTYDHGDVEVPGFIVAMCCRMVLAVLLAPTMTEGLVQERIGQYQYGYGQFPGGGSPGATVRMTDADRTELRQAGYRRSSGTIQLRA